MSMYASMTTKEKFTAVNVCVLNTRTTVGDFVIRYVKLCTLYKLCTKFVPCLHRPNQSVRHCESRPAVDGTEQVWLSSSLFDHSPRVS